MFATQANRLCPYECTLTAPGDLQRVRFHEEQLSPKIKLPAVDVMAPPPPAHLVMAPTLDALDTEEWTLPRRSKELVYDNTYVDLHIEAESKHDDPDEVSTVAADFTPQLTPISSYSSEPVLELARPGENSDDGVSPRSSTQTRHRPAPGITGIRKATSTQPQEKALEDEGIDEAMAKYKEAAKELAVLGEQTMDSLQMVFAMLATQKTMLATQGASRRPTPRIEAGVFQDEYIVPKRNLSALNVMVPTPSRISLRCSELVNREQCLRMQRRSR